MDLNLIATFVVVAETSSFSAAARKLGVPTSTASRAVMRLEKELGVRLFQRTTRHVSLSTDGAALFERVAPALGALEGAIGAASADEPSGVLRITSAPDVGTALLAGAITRFSARYPAVSVDVWLTSRSVNLAAEGFDLAVRATGGRLGDSSMVARKLVPFEMQLFASRGYLQANGAPRSPKDVANHRVVLMRNVKLPREVVLPPAESRIVADEFDFVRECVRAGGGIGFLPTFRAEPDVAAGVLERVLPRISQTGGSVVLLHARNAGRKVTAFRDFLIADVQTAQVSPRTTRARATV